MNTQLPPYPPIQVEGPNPRYAKEILGNIGGVDSEMSAAALYFYDQLVTGEYPELSQAFQRICIEEMRHLEIFCRIATQLGADPRLWERAGRRPRYWSPKDLHYSRKPRKILMNALMSEHLTIDKYTRQAKLIHDESIVQNLRRIIDDEKAHIQLLTGLLKTY